MKKKIWVCLLCCFVSHYFESNCAQEQSGLQERAALYPISYYAATNSAAEQAIISPEGPLLQEYLPAAISRCVIDYLPVSWHALFRSNNAPVALHEQQGAKVEALCISPDGRFVAAGLNCAGGGRNGRGTRSEIRVWDMKRGAQAWAVLHKKNMMQNVTFTSDHTIAFIDGPSSDASLYLWDLCSQSQACVMEKSLGADVLFGCDYAHLWEEILNDQVLADSLQCGIRDLYDVSDYEWRNHITSAPGGKRCAFSLLAAEVTIWDLDIEAKQAKMVTTLKNEKTTSLRHLDFSPDGDRLITISDDGLIATLWDAQTGEKQMQLLFRQGNRIAYVFFSPDGRYLLLGSCYSSERGRIMVLPLAALDSQVKIWNMDE